jgi:precorrin-6B methylase 2
VAANYCLSEDQIEERIFFEKSTGATQIFRSHIKMLRQVNGLISNRIAEELNAQVLAWMQFID